MGDKKDDTPGDGDVPLFGHNTLCIHDLPGKTHAYYEQSYKTSDRIYKLFSWIIYASLFYFVYRETSSTALGLISWVCYFILVTIVSLNVSAYLLYIGSYWWIKLQGNRTHLQRQHPRFFGYGFLMLFSLAIIDSFFLTSIQHLIHHVQDIIHMQSNQAGGQTAFPRVPPP